MDNYIQTPQQVSEQPTSDERLLAMFSHFSIFIGGIILPIILYFVQKGKSKFVMFHALQSIFFHLLYLVFIFVLVVFLVVVLLATGAFTLANSRSMGPETGMGFIVGIIIFYGGLIISVLSVIAYGIFMGIKAYGGENKKYFLVGNWAWKKVYGN
ncbi:MAG: DUF4870 domain-containing protein [Bacteroidetes bacterium]|nr:DUF4870 domain-containing protein [Bacteroidota bacterium]